MNTTDYQELQQWAKDTKREAGGWEGDVGSGDHPNDAEMEDILNRISNDAGDLTVILSQILQDKET